jgi:hypothetical protein
MSDRELDQRIAVEITGGMCLCEKDEGGWSIHGYGSAGGRCYGCFQPHAAPHYTEDIRAAMQVVDAMINNHSATVFTVDTLIPNSDVVVFTVSFKEGTGAEDFNLPTAICNAALTAKGAA